MYEDVVAKNIGFCYVNGIFYLQLEMWVFLHIISYIFFVFVDVLNDIHNRSITCLQKKQSTSW